MRNILDALAIKAENMWPSLKYKSGKSSRAQAAKWFVLNGNVKPLGSEVYQVGDYKCSYSANFCDCADRSAPIDRQHGKICKHRLAVMFFRSKALSGQNDWLTERVGYVATLAANGWFDLVFESDYDRPAVKRLIGYSTNGSTTIRFDRSGEVTLEQMRAACAAVGVNLERLPTKLGEWSYAFRFSPSGKSRLHEGTWEYKAAPTEAMLKRAEWQLGPEEAAKLRALAAA